MELNLSCWLYVFWECWYWMCCFRGPEVGNVAVVGVVAAVAVVVVEVAAAAAAAAAVY